MRSLFILYIFLLSVANADNPDQLGPLCFKSKKMNDCLRISQEFEKKGSRQEAISHNLEVCDKVGVFGCYLAAELYIKDNNFLKADPLYQRACRDSNSLCNNWGAEQEARGQISKAKESYKKGCSSTPKIEPRACLNLARLEAKDGNFTEVNRLIKLSCDQDFLSACNLQKFANWGADFDITPYSLDIRADALWKRTLVTKNKIPFEVCLEFVDAKKTKGDGCFVGGFCSKKVSQANAIIDLAEKERKKTEKFNVSFDFLELEATLAYGYAPHNVFLYDYKAGVLESILSCTKWDENLRPFLKTGKREDVNICTIVSRSLCQRSPEITLDDLLKNRMDLLKKLNSVVSNFEHRSNLEKGREDLLMSGTKNEINELRNYLQLSEKQTVDQKENFLNMTRRACRGIK